MFKILVLFFITTNCFSQTHTITGVVSDATNKPLESANVIAKPLQEKDNLKFSITIINFVRSGASYYPQAGINFLVGLTLKF